MQFGDDDDMSAVSKMGIIFLHSANSSLSGRMGRHNFVCRRPQDPCHFHYGGPSGECI